VLICEEEDSESHIHVGLLLECKGKKIGAKIKKKKTTHKLRNSLQKFNYKY